MGALPPTSSRSTRSSRTRPSSSGPPRSSAAAASSPSRPRRSTASAPTPWTRPPSARIFAAKRRALDDPLIVHVASTDDLAAIVAEVAAGRARPRRAVLARAADAGPAEAPVVPDVATAGLPTVAVRVPSHPVAQALIRAAGLPIAAPSANLFTRASATTAAARRGGSRRPRRPDPGWRAGLARHRVDGRGRRRRRSPTAPPRRHDARGARRGALGARPAGPVATRRGRQDRVAGPDGEALLPAGPRSSC